MPEKIIRFFCLCNSVMDSWRQNEKKYAEKNAAFCIKYSTTSESYSGKEHQKLFRKIKRRSAKYGMTVKVSTKALLCFNLKNERLGVRFALKLIKLFNK